MSGQNAYEMAADNVLAYVIGRPSNWQKVYLERNIRPLHFPIADRALYAALISIHQDGKALNDTLLKDRYPELDLQRYAYLVAAYDRDLEAKISNDLDVLYKHGMNEGLRVMLQAAEIEIQKRGYKEVISSLMTVLPQLGQEMTVSHETVPQLVDLLEIYLSQPAHAIHLTGLDWLDNATGGISANDEINHLWWIAGPYKSRKTTLMLNMALGIHAMHYVQNTMDKAPSTAILSREMPRFRVLAQFGAMLAVHWLIGNGYEKTADDKGYALTNISADALLKSRGQYRNWHPIKVKAIDESKKLLRAILPNMRIYDATTEGGGLSNFASIRRILDRDKFMYETNLVFSDYFQLFNDGTGKNESAVLAAGAQLCQQMTRTLKLTMIMLAQQNEESIKSNNDTSYSPNIKGTGAAAATADYVLTTKYGTDDMPHNRLKVTLKLSRERESGQYTTFNIHPESGLLTEAKWVQRNREVQEF
jgi:hypothetical protein